MKSIDYAEAQGQTNFAWQTAADDAMRREANTTLGFLLAGGGTALAWSISQAAQKDGKMALAAAVLVLGVWLFGLAALVLLRCLDFSLAMPPANQPLNVYFPQYDTEHIRAQQLEHLETAILMAIANGQQRARWLRRARLLACVTPAVFIMAWAACQTALH